jgi:uncharacterized protein (UPF0333 family)
MDDPMVKRGQVTLELAFGFALAIILFYASVTLFLYLNNRMVERQQEYERGAKGRGRVAGTASSASADIQVDEAALPSLDFFD